MVLLYSSVAVAGAWALLALHAVTIQRRRESAAAARSAVLGEMQSEPLRHLAADERLARVRPRLEAMSRELIMELAADRSIPDAATEVLVQHLMCDRGAERLVSDASTHRTPREKWRRMAALQILAHREHPSTIGLLAAAVESGDAEVTALAFFLLGRCRDARAADVLLDGLRRRPDLAPRIAPHLDRSPHSIAHRLKDLLADANPELRLWGATLLAKRGQLEGLEGELIALAGDADPRVRKAAADALGRAGGARAVERLRSLLSDSCSFVRAQAARAIGDVGRADLAAEVANLLGDEDWWVRQAAKESLQLMGPDVWPVAMRCLEHDDRFVRNGAAEVFQNLGVLDSLIVMEAASDNPSHGKIDLLRRIAAAGGVGFTESLVERAGPVVGPRVRLLLETMGLEHVGAC
jgi:HEAT repeat protein